MESHDIVLRVDGLQTHLESNRGKLRAVDGVSFELARGRTFALLGESGCGKSMTALSIMRLLPPAGRTGGGAVWLRDRNLLALPEREMRELRGRRIAMIFQEPHTSLNPVLTVGHQIGEMLQRSLNVRGSDARDRVHALLEEVGISDPIRRARAYPHQLSGGMKQRVMIASALACKPDLLIADEPTTALDVTTQAQVLDLLRTIQEERGMALLLITHDLGVVAEMADEVGVMYAGHLVELAKSVDFFSSPNHPYAARLFASLPAAARRGQGLAVIPGTVPPLNRQFSGCRFKGRCHKIFPACDHVAPELIRLSDDRSVRCLLYHPEFADGSAPDVVSEGSLPRPIPPEILEEQASAAEQIGIVVDGDIDAAGSPDMEEIAEGYGGVTFSGPRYRSSTGRADDSATDPILSVRDLKVHFPVHKGVFRRTVGHIRAVDGVSFVLEAGRTLALVGESGCGKTTTGKGILQLVRPAVGSVRFQGEELTSLPRRGLRKYRRDMQIVFQNPYASMNPRMTVGEIIAEGLWAQGLGGVHEEQQQIVSDLLHQVGLKPAACTRYPHEFSGGQRQRICIARALAVQPKLLVCDEPTSALDVSVQAQVLNLLQDLQVRLGLAYLFITHDLSVVEYLAQDVAVMYLGRIVERGTVEEVLSNPRHPYTKALLAAIPSVDPRNKTPVLRIDGEQPSPSSPPTGCHFHPRCPHAVETCRLEYPEATRVGDSHHVHCFRQDVIP